MPGRPWRHLQVRLLGCRAALSWGVVPRMAGTLGGLAAPGCRCTTCSGTPEGMGKSQLSTQDAAYMAPSCEASSAVVLGGPTWLARRALTCAAWQAGVAT